MMNKNIKKLHDKNLKKEIEKFVDLLHQSLNINQFILFSKSLLLFLKKKNEMEYHNYYYNTYCNKYWCNFFIGSITYGASPNNNCIESHHHFIKEFIFTNSFVSTNYLMNIGFIITITISILLGLPKLLSEMSEKISKIEFNQKLIYPNYIIKKSLFYINNNGQIKELIDENKSKCFIMNSIQHIDNVISDIRVNDLLSSLNGCAEINSNVNELILKYKSLHLIKKIENNFVCDCRSFQIFFKIYKIRFFPQWESVQPCAGSNETC